ncbi:MAG: hypothetical protein GY679_03070 [Mycoplasma sp.]|nr:hypothetical protein [Mycoplasma sp.]
MKWTKIISFFLILAPIISSIFIVFSLYQKRKTPLKKIINQKRVINKDIVNEFPALTKEDLYDLIRINGNYPYIDDNFMINAAKRIIEKIAPSNDVRISYTILGYKSANLLITINNISHNYLIKLFM